jgi:hypothetical protein
VLRLVLFPWSKFNHFTHLNLLRKHLQGRL